VQLRPDSKLAPSGTGPTCLFLTASKRDSASVSLRTGILSAPNRKSGRTIK
jgi:hypothetical protein